MRAKNGKNFTWARSLCRIRTKKRQKLRSGVKEKSATRQKAAETVQRRKGKVAKERKNGRKFTVA